VIRRLLALLLAASVSLGSPGVAHADYSPPWWINVSGDSVDAAFTSDTLGTEVAIALTNRTSIADALGLDATTAVVLEALGLSGAYSQTAVWENGTGPELHCPPDRVNFGCQLVGDWGAVVIPRSVRAALLARAPSSTGDTSITIAPDTTSLAFDLTLVVVGIALEAGCVGGPLSVPEDTVVKLAIAIYPTANGLIAALARQDLDTARAELLAMAKYALVLITEGLVGAAAGAALCLLSSTIPGVIEIKMSIAIAKAILPILNLDLALLRGGAESEVVVGYIPGTPVASPPASPSPVVSEAPGTTYSVQVGDTGVGIAQRFGLTFDQLQAFNPQVADWNRLSVGDLLLIPVVTTPAPPVATPPAPTPTSAPKPLTMWVSATDDIGRDPIPVAPGERLRITTSGTWCTGGIKPDGTASCGGADGIRPAGPGETDVQLPSALIGALIGRFGAGPWFYIGSNATVTVPQNHYVLMLACNDRWLYYSDNSGSITVAVTRTP
jgi:hypothetical protein